MNPFVTMMSDYVDTRLGHIYRRARDEGKLSRFAECLRRVPTTVDFTAEARQVLLDHPHLKDAMDRDFVDYIQATRRAQTVRLVPPPLEDVLSPFLGQLTALPYLQSGAYFADSTPPLHRKDCVRDALHEAFERCVESGLATEPEEDPMLWPSDSISNVGERVEAKSGEIEVHISHAPSIAPSRTTGE